jgi:hypothetical protein
VVQDKMMKHVERKANLTQENEYFMGQKTGDMPIALREYKDE